MDQLGGILSSVFVILITAAVWRFLLIFWWRPMALAAQLKKHGVRGPPPKFMVGQMLEIGKMRRKGRECDMGGLNHDILEHAFPDYHEWSRKYGKRYAYWFGTEPRIMLSDPELVREVLSKKVTQFQKSEETLSGIVNFVGRGLLAVIGDEWAHRRRVVAPAFHFEKLKKMVATMVKCTSDMLDKWEVMMQHQSEIEICREFAKLTADIISHTAFGSSYAKGQRAFEILTELPELFNRTSRYSWIPGSRYFPLPLTFKIWKLKKELDSVLLGVINERREMIKRGRSMSYGDDLLGLMLTENENDKSFTFNDRDLIGECKTFYLAGHETTASLLSWTMMLLAAYPDWQERARAEVQDNCKDGVIDADIMSKLKLVGMIVNETLRLYPPAILFLRSCFEDTWLQDVFIPKGAAVTFPILSLHHDKELWGPDANEFNPERFKDGISNACKHPNAFIPFSMGPRVCVGQSFALIEVKVALATILQRFSFQLSPKYRHSPVPLVTLKPFHGVPLILNKL